MQSPRLDEEVIFHVARDIPVPESRRTYLDQICAGDQALRERVEALLEVHENEQAFLKSDLDAAPTVDHTPLTEHPGSTIGRYKLMEQIGEGGMGTVFVAEQERPIRRKVALKVIKPGMDSKAVVARFEAERQALALMDHPNIAKVLDAGTTDSGRPYFVMELVRGVPITDYCDEHKLTIRERLELFTQVCQAIQHAHQKAIIHRDIKPTNVLVTEQDGKAVPKVIDFGVAKALNQRLTDRTIYTSFAQVVGTPLYMSPEQAALSAVDVDTRSDVYSLGVLLYELLTGTTPFDKQRFEQAAYDEIRRIVREEEPPKPSTRITTLGDVGATVAQNRRTEYAKLARAVRGDLDWIVIKALEKDRTRRYETASGLASDVLRYLDEEPVQACPPSRFYRIRKLVRRHRTLVCTTLAFLLLLLVGFAAATTGWIRAVTEQEIANKQRRVADSAKKELRRQHFARTTEAAFEAWQSGSLSRLKGLLESQEQDRDLLGFESRFLRSRCAENALTFKLSGGVQSVAISPNGRWIAVGHSAGGLSIIDAVTNKENIGPRHRSIIPDGLTPRKGTFVTFSQDGFLLAGGAGSDSGWLRRWRFTPGEESPEKELDLPFRPSKAVEHVTIGANANLAAYTSNGVATIWELESGTVVQTLRHAEENRQVSSMQIALSPDDSLVATTAHDRQLKLWQLDTGQCLLTKQLASKPYGVSFSPDGSLLASNDSSGLSIWFVDDGTLIERVPRLTWRRHFDLDFSPCGRYLAAAGCDNSTAWVWDLTSSRQTRKYLHQDRVQSVDFSSDGKWLVSGSSDGTVRLFDQRRPAMNMQNGLSHWFAPLAVSPDSKTVAFARSDGVVVLWDTVSGKTRDLVGHSRTVMGMAFSDNGLAFASGSGDGTVRLWNPGTLELIEELTAHTGLVWSVALSKDARWLASGSKNELLLWDLEAGQHFPLWVDGGADFFATCFSPDGRYLAAAAQEVRIYDVQTRKIRSRCSYQRAHSVEFSPDGKSLVVAGTKSFVKIFDVETGSPTQFLRGYGTWLTTAAISPDGETVVAVSPAGEVRFWRMPSGKEAGTWNIDSGVRRVRFTPDGNGLVLASMDGRVEYWDAVPKTGDTRP